MQSIQSEGRICLAISAINKNQFQSERRAIATYNVPRSTLKDRRAGTTARRDCEANSKKLTKLEESVIVQHILDLDSRGFAPNLNAVRDMANKLLVERGASQVGKNWPNNFVKRTDELKTQFNRKYDRQRALCEDPEIISPWFVLVRNTKTKYGITDDDSYNFDETGFQMGVITTGMVVTGSERRNRPKAIQPGNREWATVIQGINACGWAIPPFIILAGKYHLSAWYEGSDIPSDWAIAVSDNGWTTNELGIAWLQHFDMHTKDRTIGTHRLLILDGHESHNSLEFKELCKKNNIITLCMPPHASHLLQPLDVGCFAPLKKAYGCQIENLARNYINHITKLEFLPAFKAAFDDSITKNNICASFRGAGLVPYDPEAVLAKLDVKLRTPSPLPQAVAPWESKTPSNAAELGSQSILIRNRIQRHQDSSPTAILDSLDQLTRGAEIVMHSSVLLRDQVASLQKANEAATKRRERKKKRIQKQGTLTKAQGSEIIAQRNVDEQIEGEMQQKRMCSGGNSRQKAHCRRCGKTGHNARTCQNDEEIVID
jgi:hypothetical protein